MMEQEKEKEKTKEKKICQPKSTRFEDMYTHMRIDKNVDEIKCISYDSLYSFVFLVKSNYDLIVNRENRNIGKDTKEQEKKKDNYFGNKYILKFTILNNTNPDKEITPAITINKKKFPKYYSSIDDFEKEANTQSDIFRKSYMFAGLKICPKIITSVAMNKVIAGVFLDTIESHVVDENSREKHVITFLRNTKADIGLIAMEYIEGMELFETFLNETGNNKEKAIEFLDTLQATNDTPTLELNNILLLKKKTINVDLSDVKDIYLLLRVARVLSTMILMVFEFGYLHYDLHLNNIFVHNTDTRTGGSKSCDKLDNILDADIKQSTDTLNYCCAIIDFGRVKPITELNEEKQNNLQLYNIFKKKKVDIQKSHTQEQVDIQKSHTQEQVDIQEASLDDYETIKELLVFIFNKDMDLINKINSNIVKPQCYDIFEKGGLLINQSPNYNLQPLTLNDFNNNFNVNYVFFLINQFFNTTYTITNTAYRGNDGKPTNYKYNKHNFDKAFKKIFNKEKEDEKLILNYTKKAILTSISSISKSEEEKKEENCEEPLAEILDQPQPGTSYNTKYQNALNIFNRTLLGIFLNHLLDKLKTSEPNTKYNYDGKTLKIETIEPPATSATPEPIINNINKIIENIFDEIIKPPTK